QDHAVVGHGHRHRGQVDITTDPAGDAECGGHERELVLLGSGDRVAREHATVGQRDQERYLVAVATAVACVVCRQWVRRFTPGSRAGTQLFRIVERGRIVGKVFQAVRKGRSFEVVPVVVAVVVAGSVTRPLQRVTGGRGVGRGGQASHQQRENADYRGAAMSSGSVIP